MSNLMKTRLLNVIKLLLNPDDANNKFKKKSKLYDVNVVSV